MRRLRLPIRGDGDNDVSLILVDEAARVPDEMYHSVRPMLAVGNGALWLMSTPLGKRGFFWEAWDRGKEPWTRISVPATSCPRITPEFLIGERQALGERRYAQDYLCEFTDADDQLFKDEFIQKAITKGLKPLSFDVIFHCRFA